MVSPVTKVPKCFSIGQNTRENSSLARTLVGEIILRICRTCYIIIPLPACMHTKATWPRRLAVLTLPRPKLFPTSHKQQQRQFSTRNWISRLPWPRICETCHAPARLAHPYLSLDRFKSDFNLQGPGQNVRRKLGG